MERGVVAAALLLALVGSLVDAQVCCKKTCGGPGACQDVFNVSCAPASCFKPAQECTSSCVANTKTLKVGQTCDPANDRCEDAVKDQRPKLFCIDEGAQAGTLDKTCQQRWERLGGQPCDYDFQCIRGSLCGADKKCATLSADNATCRSTSDCSYQSYCDDTCKPVKAVGDACDPSGKADQCTRHTWCPDTASPQCTGLFSLSTGAECSDDIECQTGYCDSNTCKARPTPTKLSLLPSCSSALDCTTAGSTCECNFNTGVGVCMTGDQLDAEKVARTLPAACEDKRVAFVNCVISTGNNCGNVGAFTSGCCDSEFGQLTGCALANWASDTHPDVNCKTDVANPPANTGPGESASVHPSVSYSLLATAGGAAIIMHAL